ncbi:MAG: hypothetical protein DMG80_01510 [Acidobacteria bacterium]|nr:MAG: hypothetical protein DMG80_01510 [Acidobacteriota bacterium]
MTNRGAMLLSTMVAGPRSAEHGDGFQDRAKFDQSTHRLWWYSLAVDREDSVAMWDGSHWDHAKFMCLRTT